MGSESWNGTSTFTRASSGTGGAGGSRVMLVGALCVALIPEIKKVKPLRRGQQTMSLEPLRVTSHFLLERLAPPRPRQHYSIGERFQEHAILAADLRAEHEIYGARQQAREHEGSLRKRRGPP